jgi:hypothetical protein
MTKISVAMLALLASLCSFARAADFKGDNSACWDDNSRQDISCTKLTDAFLMSLRFKKKAEIQKLMNAAGRQIPNKERLELRFLSNYTRGKEEGSGDLNVWFGDDGKAIIIRANVDSDNDSHSHAKFLWSANFLPKGCYSKPTTATMYCTLTPQEELEILVSGGS